LKPTRSTTFRFTAQRLLPYILHEDSHQPSSLLASGEYVLLLVNAILFVFVYTIIFYPDAKVNMYLPFLCIYAFRILSFFYFSFHVFSSFSLLSFSTVSAIMLSRFLLDQFTIPVAQTLAPLDSQAFFICSIARFPPIHG